MERIVTKVKKWGNSLGVILPSGVVRNQDIKEGSELELTIQSRGKMTVGDLFNLGRKMKLKKKGDTQKILDEIDKELWPEDE